MAKASGSSRRIPTEAQASLVAKRAQEILAACRQEGLPAISAIEVGPVRLEFQTGSPQSPSEAERDKWEGKPFG